MYEVLNDFIEKNHNGHFYKKGDKYPARDFKLTKTRATELTKIHEKYGVAFLKEIETAKTNARKKTTPTTTVEDKAGEE